MALQWGSSHPLTFHIPQKKLVRYVTALQVGGHVPMVTSHLWLSEWQHTYFMNAITIHARVILHTELWQKVTNEHDTGEWVLIGQTRVHLDPRIGYVAISSPSLLKFVTECGLTIINTRLKSTSTKYMPVTTTSCLKLITNQSDHKFIAHSMARVQSTWSTEFCYKGWDVNSIYREMHYRRRSCINKY